MKKKIVRKFVLLVVLVALVTSLLAFTSPVGARNGCGDPPKKEGPCIVCMCRGLFPWESCYWHHNTNCMMEDGPGPHH